MAHDIPAAITGKVLLCLMRDSQAVIANVRFDTIGDRLFALGSIPAGVLRGFDDRELAIAWEQVEQFYIFDSVEECRAANREWKKGKKKNWFDWV